MQHVEGHNTRDKQQTINHKGYKHQAKKQQCSPAALNTKEWQCYSPAILTVMFGTECSRHVTDKDPTNYGPPLLTTHTLNNEL